MTDAIITALAVAGVLGQALAAALALLGLLCVAGVRGPWRAWRRLVWGYELWLAFGVAGLATAGSLFFSEVAGFVPCELCWFQRLFTYPVALVVLLAALANDFRVARYLLPLPVLGAGFSSYHLLVENGVVEQTQGCLLSAPGGCATKWIDELGYVTIPTLALTAFVLTFTFLGLASLPAPEDEHGFGRPR